VLVSQRIERMVGHRTLEIDKVFAGLRPDHYAGYVVPSIFDPFAIDLKAHLSVFCQGYDAHNASLDVSEMGTAN
jgi:hypothetical protein